MDRSGLKVTWRSRGGKRVEESVRKVKKQIPNLEPGIGYINVQFQRQGIARQTARLKYTDYNDGLFWVVLSSETGLLL